MMQLPVFTDAMTEDDSTSEVEEHPITQRRKQLKSGMHQTGASMVVKSVIWPYEVVYTMARKPAVYQDMSLPLFLQGYMIIMKDDEGATKERMATYIDDLMPGHSMNSSFISSSRGEPHAMTRRN